MKTPLNQNLQSTLFVLFTGFCFGTSLVSSRLSLQYFDPPTFIFLRLCTASTVFLLFYAIQRRKLVLTRTLIWHGIVTAVLSAVLPIYSFLFALSFLSSGLTAIINTVGPAVTVILAHFFLQGERLSRRTIIGVALALSGAVLLALRGESGLNLTGAADLRGYMFVFMALLSISLSTIYVRRYASDIDVFDLTSIQIYIAVIGLLPIHLIFIGFDFSQIGIIGVGTVLYGGIVGTFIAFTMYYVTLRRFGATTVAMVAYANPVAASLGGMFVLGETITLIMVVGMIIIGVGIYIINTRNRG